MKTKNNLINNNLRDRLTLIDLNSAPGCELSVKMRFTAQVRHMLEQGQDLFPSILGLDHIKRRLVEVLMTGHGTLLQGDFGVGKTELARSIFQILSAYYFVIPVYSPVNCPVRENAIYLYNFIVNKDNSVFEKICPVCRHNYLEKPTAADDIQIERVLLTREEGLPEFRVTRI